jgi:hypothetical protein
MKCNIKMRQANILVAAAMLAMLLNCGIASAQGA